MNINKVLSSILSMKMRYMPIMAIYFAASFAAFSTISETFWIKNSLSLSASEVISITIWINLPWSMKIIFGQMLDSWSIFGSRRNIYIYLAGLIMFIGSIVNIGIANQFPFIIKMGSYFELLVFSGFLIQLAVVIQDLIADTLCYDVVVKVDNKGNPIPELEIKEEIGKIQIIASAVQIIGALLAAGISGIIAAKFSYGTISYFIPIISLISISGCLIARKEPKLNKETVNLPLVIGGAIYIGFIILTIITKYQYSQEAIFIVGMIIVSLSLYSICKHLELKKRIEIFMILLVIFTFRAVPTYGPGVEWWQIDVLKFTPEFFGVLKQISLILGFISFLFFAKRIVNMDICIVLLLLNTIHVILQIPMIGMAYGLHEWTMKHFGFGAQTIALIDNISEGPFYKLSFLMLCTVATQYAPKKNVGTWFALVMSLMSLAFVSGGRILKRVLSEIFVVERGSYDNVADLMITTTMINLLLPTIIILGAMYVLNKVRN